MKKRRNFSLLLMLLTSWLSIVSAYADNVARIGDVEYASLAEAVAAVPDNSETTIMMIGSEALNAGVTIAVPAAYCAEGGEPTDHVVTFLLRDEVGDMTIAYDSSVYTLYTQEGVERSGAAVYNYMTQTVANGDPATAPAGEPSYWYHSGKTFPEGNNTGIPFTVEQSQAYVFDGWRLSGTNVRYDFSTPVTSDITLVPHFSAVEAVFEINTEADLFAFAREVTLGRSYRSKWGGFPRQTVKLMNNITLTSNWTPIPGNFRGIFDGNNHTISGLVINDTNNETGFFRTSGNGGSSFEIKDLTFQNPQVTSSGCHVGVLAGKMDGATVTNVTINYPAVLCTSTDNVGGLVGSVNNNVNDDQASASVFSGCSVNGGTISCTGSDGRMVGGLIGQGVRYLTITDCSVSNVTINGYRKLGGLIGQANGTHLTCTNASVSGVTINALGTTIYDKNLTMGGFVGQFATPTQSTITGTVSDLTMTGPESIASGNNYIMGLVSGGTGGTAEAAETAMSAANMTFDVTISGTNTCTVPNESTYAGIRGTAAAPADPVVTFQMVDDVGKIVIQGLDDNVHTNVFDTWFDGVNNRPNIRVAFTQTVTSGSTATKPTNTPYYDYNITQPNNGNPKNFTNDDSHTYTFDGWATSDGALYDFDTPVTENLTLHPRFSATGATILIKNETELRAFAREVKLGRKFREQWGEEKQTVKLADDITLTSNWTPVAGFEGIFDGDNHSISGLVISATGDYAGFFSGLNSHTVVKDLTFVSPTVTSTDEYVGVLAGSASSNASTIHPQVSNVNVTGAFSVSGENNVGALIGQVNNGVQIEDCSVDGTSVASSTIAGNSASGRPIGGLLGNTIGAVTITDCTVENVTVTGARKLGGLIGQIQSNSSNASVTCTGVSVSNVKIVSTAATTFSSALTMGGLVGIFASPFAANSITGTVSDVNMTGPANIADGKVYVMGLVSGGTGDALATAESSMDGAGMTFDVTISGTNTLAVPNESTYAGINGVSPVAKIGNVKYTSLAAAISAVPTDGTATTITMLDNETVADGTTLTIPANKNIVLDLNGKTISGSSSDSGNSFYFLTNRGTLEITDNSVGAEGKITYGCSSPNTGYSKEYVTIYNIGGTLTLTEGTVENRSGYLSYAINNSSNAWGNNDDKETVFTMTGGCISAPSGDAALRVYQNCAQSNTPFSHNTVTISGGKIKDSGIFLDSYIYEPNANTTGEGILTTVTISGGEIHGLIDLKLRHAFNTSLTITGGTFVDSKLWVRKHGEWNSVVAEPNAPIVHISGGKFSFANNKAFGLAYDCGATSWTSYTQPYDVSDGVFNVNLNDFSGIAFPEGKTGVANTDSETSEAYPYTVGSEFVAQIGETKYATLAEAIAAVPTDGTQTTITMIADETVAADLTIAASKNVVLELAGHTISETLSKSGTSALITNNGTLVIQDNTDTNKDGTGTGKITYQNGNPDQASVPGYASNTIINQGNLTIESGYIENTTSGGYAAYTVDNLTNGGLYTPTFTMNGGKLYNSYTDAVRMYLNSTTNLNKVVINGGVLDSHKASGRVVVVHMPSTALGKGELDITGGTINGTVNGWSAANDGGVEDQFSDAQYENVSINISGGCIKKIKFTEMANETLRANSLVVTGGVYKESPELYVASGYAVLDNTDEETKLAFPYKVDRKPVAQIGSTTYPSLAEAIAAVPTDGTETTITMIADETINVAGSALTIAAGKNVVLELNGKEVTGVCTTGTASALITNYGTLKIQDNTDTNKDGTGQGKMYAGANPAWIYEGGENYAGSYASNMISNRGNLTIESGYFESTTDGSAAYIIDNYTNGIAVINGGHLYNLHTNAIRLFCNSTTDDNSLTVNGGIIEGCGAIWLQGASQTTEKGSLTINGGTFRTTEKAVVNGTKKIEEGNSFIQVWPSNSNMSFTITGGTFETNVCAWGNGAETISGGMFRGAVYNAVQTGFITAGLFSIAPNNSYIADGYVAVDNTDEATKDTYPYTVVPMQSAPNLVYYYWYSNNDIKGTYCTFKEPFTRGWLADGEYIKLQKDVTLNSDITCSLAEGESFYLELNGHNLSQDANAQNTPHINIGKGVSVYTDAEIDGILLSANNCGIVKTDNTDDTYHYKYTAIEGVARINDTVYPTLAEAIAASATGDEIVMIANSNENVLYGVTSPNLKNKTVTISGAYTLTSPLTSPDERFGFYFGDYDNGNRPETDKLSVSDITMAKSGGDYTTLFDGVTADLTNVTVNGDGNTALSYANGAVGTLTNVTVTNTGSHTQTWRNTALALQGIGSGPSKVTVKSGSYTSVNGYAVYMFSSGGTLNIEGGTFSGALMSQIDNNSYPDNQSIINISGGTFANCTLTESGGENAQIYVSGGTFSIDPTPYVLPGYAAVETVIDNTTWWKVGEVVTGDMTKQDGATATQATYTVETQVVDGNEVLSTTTNTTVTVAIAGENNVAVDAELDDLKMDNVVSKSVKEVPGNDIDVKIAVVATAETPAVENTLVFEVHPEATVYVSNVKQSTVELENSDLATGATFTFKLPVTGTFADGTEVKVVHKSSDPATYPNETFYATVSEGKVTITVSHFSDFELSALQQFSELDVVLVDGTSYEECVGRPVTEDVVVNSAKYQRTVSKADTWCAWYVPMDHTLTQSDLDNATFYRINLIANAEYGNEVESTDKIWVYLNKMSVGEKLTANRPYAFKSKYDNQPMEFAADGNKIYAPTTNSRLENSTTAYYYNFFGTYASTPLQDTSEHLYYYVSVNGGMSWPGNSSINVGPYRWYVEATQKGGGAYYAPEFVFMDDSDVTSVNDEILEKTVDCYYNLQGMKVDKPAKGTYIVKFTDGTIRKVVM